MINREREPQDAMPSNIGLEETVAGGCEEPDPSPNCDPPSCDCGGCGCDCSDVVIKK